MYKFAIQEFGHFNFSPQALAYDWVGGAVYAGGYNSSAWLSDCQNITCIQVYKFYSPCFSVLYLVSSCGTSKCLYQLNLNGSGQLSLVASGVTAGLAVNVRTGCLYTIDQHNGTVMQRPYSSSDCEAVNYSNPFSDNNIEALISSAIHTMLSVTSPCYDNSIVDLSIRTHSYILSPIIAQSRP